MPATRLVTLAENERPSEARLPMSMAREQSVPKVPLADLRSTGTRAQLLPPEEPSR